MLALLSSLVLALVIEQAAPPAPPQQTPPPAPPAQSAPPATPPAQQSEPPAQTPPPAQQTAPQTPPPAQTPPPTAPAQREQSVPPPPPPVSNARRLAEPEKAGPIVLPMELVAGRPVIRMTINGKGPYAFLVSTGAQTTVIDQKLAEELQLKPPVPEKDKAADGKNGTAPKDNGDAKEAKEKEKRTPGMLELDLEAGQTKLTKVPVLATDISKYVAEAGLAARSRGVISLAVWKDQLVTIGFPPRSKVTVEPGTLPEPNGEDIFPLDPETGELRMTVTIADQKIPCRVEPLSPGGLMLPEPLLKQMLLDGTPIELGTMPVAGQLLTVREARLAYSAMLANFELPNPVVRFAGAGDSATAGSQSLVGLSITYDLTNNRAKVTRQPAPTPR